MKSDIFDLSIQQINTNQVLESYRQQIGLK